MQDTNQTKMLSTLRIGTRASPLALAQAHFVRDMLSGSFPHLTAIDIIAITTTGDRLTNRVLSEVGGKGLFTKELENALLAGEIDLAVHSMKDVATLLPCGLDISCILPREDPREALIGASSIADLPSGVIIGTVSLRRSSQIKLLRSDALVVALRGNVNSRLQWVENSKINATFLALAGLKRLGLAHLAGGIIETSQMLPAIAQGAIGIETCLSNKYVNDLLMKFHHFPTAITIAAERAFLRNMSGSCRMPIAGFATLVNDKLTLRGEVLAIDGSTKVSGSIEGGITDGEYLGKELAAELLSQVSFKYLL